MKSIVTIGGGTGQYTLLSGLKKYPVDLTAIVSMADNGGSTGILRDELGVLPPGDVRQCLVALSESEAVMRELFNYRFDTGTLSGHNFGNIFLSALEKITGNFEEAVRVAGSILSIRGQVVPVTTESIMLSCGSSTKIVGEDALKHSTITEKATLRIEPAAYANPKAAAAIENADCIIIGPGDLYCSVIPNLLVQGIPHAIQHSKAAVVYNCNLMNKQGHTDGFTVMDYVREIERYIGPGRINFVIFNNQRPDQDLLEKYAIEGEHPVVAEGIPEDATFKPIGADLISSKFTAPKKNDLITRTLIRHNADLLAALIIQHCLGQI